MIDLLSMVAKWIVPTNLLLAMVRATHPDHELLRTTQPSWLPPKWRGSDL
jgi:hypothetical protein